MRGEESLWEQIKRSQDAHQKEREVLFANEAFLIGVLQVVSGGSMFAAFAQTQAIVSLTGQVPFLGFLTFMGVALVAAVLAAYFKHQYKMWDVKSAATGDSAEAVRRSRWSSRYLKAMRAAMLASVAVLALGVLGLLVTAWGQQLSRRSEPPRPPPKAAPAIPGTPRKPDVRKESPGAGPSVLPR